MVDVVTIQSKLCDSFFIVSKKNGKSFLKCCFNLELVGHHFECDRINCKGNHSPEFPDYCEKSRGLHCYCLNRQQLGQYWRCIVEDCRFLCQSQCGRCSICNKMSHIFVKLQDIYLFQPNVIYRSASDGKPLQLVMWRIFNRHISKNNNSFNIEIAKSIPHIGIGTNYGKTN